MVLDLKLSRLQDVPWGFRLAGGIDYDLPLTVVKVVENSIAQKAGLKEGDIVVRINDTSTIDLGHFDVHEIIMSCANCFVLGVRRRGEADDEEVAPAVVPSHSACFEPIDEGTLFGQSQSPCSQTISELSDHTVNGNCAESIDREVVWKVPPPEPAPQPKPAPITNDKPIPNGVKYTDGEVTDDLIAEIMSGEAEVLKEHNIIGVDFQRLIPKASIFKSSEVFKQLNEEARKTKTEKENEQRKWTTFLQKPDRPIPKSKADLEWEARIPYRVKIVKQAKPKCDPNRPPTPPEEKKSQEVVIAEEKQAVELNGDVTEAAKEASETDAPIEKIEVENVQQTEIDSELDLSIVEDGFSHSPSKADQNESNVDEANTETQPEEPKKSPEDILLEKQLADVQKQLSALSSLPSTIQATLDAVAKQLQELVPVIKSKIAAPKASDASSSNGEPAAAEDKNGGEIEETNENLDIAADDEVAAANSENVGPIGPITPNTTSVPLIEQVPEVESSTDEEIAKLKAEKTFRKQEEEWLRKREKTDNWDKIWSWTTETKGSMYKHRESNCALLAKHLEERINFLKYKKPEKDLSNLNRSEVFKIIHHIEREPRNGIPARPEKVMAADDVMRCVTPMTCQ